MATAFKMDAGWKRLEKALDPFKMDAAMRKHIRRSNQINGKLIQREVRQIIKSGTVEPNRPLTVALKGSSKPLVDSGDLFQSITSHMIDDLTVFVGIKATDEHYNIGLVLHEGTVIPVTDKMRAMFIALWEASQGKLAPDKLTGRAAELYDKMPTGWKPLKETTKVIIIPARPFIRMAFDNPALGVQVVTNWVKAIDSALKERAGQK